MSDLDQSGIERLKKSLYSRTKTPEGVRRKAPREGVGDEIKTNWGGSFPEEKTMLSVMRPLTEKAFPLRTVFFFALAFFAISVGISAYLLLRGTNVVSTQNIDIVIDGPVSVDGGKEAQFQITVTNNNTVPLQLADLLVQYPPGTRSADNINAEHVRYRESLGDIAPGRSASRNVRAVLFGEEKSVKNITATVEYRVPNSNAIFYKEKGFELTIGSTPVSLVVDSLQETTSGQEITFAISVVSNSAAPLQNVLVRGEFPFGFTFKDANPEPSFGENVWELHDLAPGAKKNIQLRGVIEGQDNEERVFRFSVGIQSEKDERALGALFLTIARPLVVKRPFISAQIALNGKSAKQISVGSGRETRVDIAWENSLPVKVNDVVIEAKLSGPAWERSSVSAPRGFYRSSDNTVIFNSQTDEALRVVEAAGAGIESFTFLTPSLSSGAADLRGGEVTIAVNIRARRTTEAGVPEDISSGASAKVVVNSDLVVSSAALRTTGPFVNTGPYPPKAEQESTYAVVWTIANSSNVVSGVKVSASLPSYMRFVGAVSPSTEKISYSAVGGVVTWDVGSLSPGVGFGSLPRQAAFQVALTPSLSQVGTVPLIVGEVSARGEDRFTGEDVSDVAGAIDTELRTDPSFTDGQQIVQP